MNKVHLGVWNTILWLCYCGDPILLRPFHWHMPFARREKKMDIAVVFQAPEDTLTYEKKNAGKTTIFFPNFQKVLTNHLEAKRFHK